MKQKKKTIKKSRSLFWAFPVMLLFICLLGVILVVYLILAPNKDSRLPVVSPSNNQNSVILKNMQFQGADILNTGIPSSDTFETTNLNLDTDANFSSQAMCNLGQLQAGTQRQIGKFQQLNIRECVHEPTAGFHCYADKAGTVVTACPTDSNGVVRTVSFSLEKPNKGIYPVVFSYNNIIPAEYKRKTDHWIITGLVKQGTIDNNIKARKVGATDFYRMECADNVTPVDNCHPENLLYYKPHWAKEFHIVEYVNQSRLDLIAGKPSG